MVCISRIFFAKARKVTRKYFKEGFRDSLKVFVAGGTGGNGLPKYNSEVTEEKLSKYLATNNSWPPGTTFVICLVGFSKNIKLFGGIGGQGGNVIVVGKESITLQDVFKQNKSKRYMAKSGMNSSHNFILGLPGENLKFEVPVGVTITTELGKNLGEINTNGEEVLLAKGGTGGNPKNGYLGTKGQAYPIIFDLKLIADVGLVGFPNAGKSTLLKAISHAKPKIASYPFTTIRPNIGIIKYKDFREISVADLPGLIEGAYANKGMGHKFLKHVERTQLLIVIVDINGFQLSPQHPQRSCLETVLLLNKELELYNKDLLAKPSMLIINKMDTENALVKYKEIKDILKNLSDAATSYPDNMKPESFLKFIDIIPISAKEDPEDVILVKQRLRRLLDITNQIESKETTEAFDIYADAKDAVSEKGPKVV